MTRDLRTGLYGLTEDELAYADSLRLSPWSYVEQYKGDRASSKSLSSEEKKSAQRVLFEERLQEHRDKLKIWMDGDGNLLLGWFRKDTCGIEWIIITAMLQPKTQTIVAIPMRRHGTDAVTGAAWERPWMVQQVWEKIGTWRRIVPSGVF